jgi:penicillin-binding protein 1A
MARRRRSKRRRGGLGRLLRRVIFATLFLGLLSVGAAGTLIYWEISSSLPSIDAVVEYRPPVATQILAEDGSVIGEFFSEKRYLTPLKEIPPHVRNAFLAAEDDDFYRHKGVDFISIARAFVNNIAAGGKVQGGSTITQQVVKSVLLTPQKSYERKIKEILLSVKLEQQLSKDQILNLYLNHIYLGSGAYGVAAAAKEYFGKDVSALSVAEAAMLAGLPQAPSRYSPFRHWPRAKARQTYVLNRMYDDGMITREQHDQALAQPLALATRQGSFVAAPYFVEHVRRLLEEHYGRTALYELGLRVHTTVDLRLQQEAEKALRAGLEEISARHDDYRSVFRHLDAGEREAYLGVQRAIVGKNLHPSRSYEALVTAVRKNGARVQVGRTISSAFARHRPIRAIRSFHSTRRPYSKVL